MLRLEHISKIYPTGEVLKDINWEVKPGVYRTIDGGGYTADYYSIGWKYTATTIKFASSMGITAKRTADTATVSVLIKRYDAGSSRL